MVKITIYVAAGFDSLGYRHILGYWIMKGRAEG
ncbi:hypothetical protein [Thermodesulfovibrio aggregans]